MDDFLREMDPAYRAFLVIFLAVAIKGFLAGQWERYKARQARKPAQTRLRNGVYEENSFVQRVERGMSVAGWVWLAWIGAMLGLLAYMKYMGWTRLF